MDHALKIENLKIENSTDCYEALQIQSYTDGANDDDKREQ